MHSNTGFDKNIPLFDFKLDTAFKKYLPVSDLDVQWGFTINDLGYSVIPSETVYPPQGHPGSHMFSWESGRILTEYHFVLITHGEGVLESKCGGREKIRAGDGFVLFPGEWHRYKPDENKGWTECWFGFSGSIADTIMKEAFFSKKQAVITNCANMLVLNLFKSLFQLISEEPFGYQRTASGVCLQLLAEVCNIQKGSETSLQTSSLISKAKYLMHKRIDEEIDFQIFCQNNRISYSKFRSDFKKQTGFAPLQYFLLLKVEKAKELLNSTNLTSKQIAYSLGFKTSHYFGRIFKEKTKCTPQEFRSRGGNSG